MINLNKRVALQFATFAAIFGLMCFFMDMMEETEEQTTYSVTLENLASANIETDGENTTVRVNQNCPPDQRYCGLSQSCIPWEEPCSLDSSTGDNGGDTVGCFTGSRSGEGTFYYDCNTCTRVQNRRGYGNSRRCTLPSPSQ